MAEKSEVSQKKLTAGLLAIFLGGLGIHKFYLGMQKPATIMLVVWILGLCTLGVVSSVMSVIGIVEGVMYLTKSDEEFERLYMVEKKEWF
jgi:TM2 domain-containing membrane protein YozV